MLHYLIKVLIVIVLFFGESQDFSLKEKRYLLYYYYTNSCVVFGFIFFYLNFQYRACLHQIKSFAETADSPEFEDLY